MVHTLPAPTAQNIQLQISQAEERELRRTEAASWAQMTPLMAAIFGPLSILLGIPSLTQRWHGQLLDPPVLPNGASNFLSLPDPTLELVLSAISLFVEILANTLLVLRFSNFHTKGTTWISYWFWIAKIFLDIANYIQFTVTYPETEDIIYLEGFWVYPLSQVSCQGRGVRHGHNCNHHHISHFQPRFSPSSKRGRYIPHQDPANVETRRLHQVQREFMLQTLIFIFVLGIAGLLFCKVENTSYVDGLYWMVTTTLLIGFGDISPHTTVMKVLAFPLIIICVILLALIVTSIVSILSDRARRRKLEMKQRLKKKLSERNRLYAIKKYNFNPWRKKEDAEELRLRRSLTLQEELEKLRNDEERREMQASLRSMAVGFGVFLVFWFVGALIFHLVEVLPLLEELN